jgi:hypothetical protein
MSTSHSSAGWPPAKPSADFPLFPHKAGYWAKKILGSLRYFGPRWGSPEEALAEYEEQKEALHAGRTLRQQAQAPTVKDVCNAFLAHKEALVQAGELTPRSWGNYRRTCELLVRQFGKARLAEDLRQEDFAALQARMAKRWGPVRMGVEIQYVRSVFRYAVESGLLARPVVFGPGFARPSAKTLRLARAKKGPQMFEAHDCDSLTVNTPDKASG